MDRSLLEQAKARARAARNAALSRMYGGASADVDREQAIREAVARARAAAASRAQNGGYFAQSNNVNRRGQNGGYFAQSDDDDSDLEGGAWGVEKRLGARKASARHQGALAKFAGRVGRAPAPTGGKRSDSPLSARRSGLNNPRLRTYVAYVGAINDVKLELLTGAPGYTKQKVLYFHGKPREAAKKVLTALARVRKQKAPGAGYGPKSSQRLAKGDLASAQTYTLWGDQSLDGQNNAVRITLVEVTKGLGKLSAQKPGDLVHHPNANYVSGPNAGKPRTARKYYVIPYAGWREEREPVQVGSFNTARTYTHVNVVVRLTVNNPTLQQALAAKATKQAKTVATLAARGRVAFQRK